MRSVIFIFSFIYVFFTICSGQIKEPYKSLYGGSYSAPLVKASPDPLITYCWDDPKPNDSLEIYTLHPKKVIGVPASSFKQTKDGIIVLGKGDLFFDFGVESAGWLEFDSKDMMEQVTASISEYNEPAIVNVGPLHRFKTAEPVKYGNSYRLELNDKLYEGVRFGWIHVKSFSKPWHIKNIRLICQTKPVNYKGSFFCNDSELMRIWYTGAYTVKLNLLQNYFGAILMDRGDRHSWTGDAYPAEAAALVAFGNYGIIKKNLVFTSDQNNGIVAYSMYWVLSLINYYNYTGDSAFLKEYIPNADKRLEKAYQNFDHLPSLKFMGWDERLGAGFENPNILEARNTYKMLCINAWRKFSETMYSIGNIRLAKKYQHFADKKTDAFENDKSRIDHFGVHAVSEAINAGLGKNNLIQKLSKQFFSDRLNRLSYSPFNQYFIIQAMAKMKYFDEALTTIKDCWGGQIAYGGTTFFEVYRSSWNSILGINDPPPNNQCGYTSLCHPWSAGVTQWISMNILGIKPIKPGFKTFTITPYFNQKITHVKGTMPTPQGPIFIDFNASLGKYLVDIPKGTKAKMIALPKTGRAVQKVKVNGQLLKEKTFHSVDDIETVKEDRHFFYVLNLAPGVYEFDVKYKETEKKAWINPKPFHYLIKNIRQDSLTSGNWKNKYGKDGFILFATPQRDVSKSIPSYIDTILLSNEKNIIWDSSSQASQALSIPSSTQRIASAIVTQDPLATLQTMTIDIKLKEKHPYKLSLYFLDWNNENRRSVIEILDFHSLEILAPVEMVENYKRGKYIIFSSNKSIRIRINQVRGKNAALSGLFFDKPNKE